jgi:hypothetical protein
MARILTQRAEQPEPQRLFHVDACLDCIGDLTFKPVPADILYSVGIKDACHLWGVCSLPEMVQTNVDLPDVSCGLESIPIL